MSTTNSIFTLQFPEAKNIIVSGDNHGDFNLLVNKLCVQYQMKDTVLIVAGDCGFGFERKGYYEGIVRRNAKRMSEANNWIVFVRGNHDNPAYFDGKTFNHKSFVAVPDYSVLQACGHSILCIGGAISIDRQYRKDSWMRQQNLYHKHQSNEPLDRNVYWSDEAPYYDANKLNAVNERFAIDTVITHTAPSFCELQSKNGLATWAANDEGNLIVMMAMLSMTSCNNNGSKANSDYNQEEFVEALANGEGNFYDGWMKNPYSAMISCNDGFRPVSFYIETIE